MASYWGDLNLSKQAVEDVTRNFQCASVESIGFVGGEGAPFLTMPIALLLPCDVLLLANNVSSHVLAMLLPCSCYDIAMLLS